MRTERFKIGILTLCFTLSGVLSLYAQETCDDLTDTVDIVYQDFQGEGEQALITIADTARRARECYEERSTKRRIWLLHKEIWALDRLGRHGEVKDLVDLFFADLVGDADDLYQGRFNLWRLLYREYAGDFEGATDAYRDALRYLNALPVAQQAGLKNNGAMLYYRRERYADAYREATEGIALLDSAAHNLDEAVELAKLLHKRAETILASADSSRLDQARGDLAAAIALRDSLRITDRQAEALVTLGEIYHALGDSPAGRGSVGRGLALARDGGNHRGEIFALWRMGRMSRRTGVPSLAHQQLQMALDLSQESGVGEFELFIELELGRLFEDGEAWKRAEGFYRAVVEAPDETRYRSSLYDVAKARDEAERRRVAVRMHLAEADASRLRLALIGSVLLILLLGGAFALQWRRTTYLQRRYAVLRNGTPEDDDLFERRRRYAYRVLTRPAEVAVVLGETALSALLLAGPLEHRTQLFACICALEEHIDERVIPQANMGRYLRRHFKKRGWIWPESVEGWQEHFRAHPL